MSPALELAALVPAPSEALVVELEALVPEGLDEVSLAALNEALPEVPGEALLEALTEELAEELWAVAVFVVAAQLVFCNLCNSSAYYQPNSR